MTTHSLNAAYDDTILLASQDRKEYVRTLKPEGVLDTHRGVIRHADLVGKAYGSAVRTHLGHLFYLLRAQPTDLIAHARYETAIIQPKDLGYIALRLGIQAGTRVVEAGTGSGALTLVLALLVGDGGHVYSYERKAALLPVAEKNLARAGVTQRVTFTVRDIAEGFDPHEADALFLDVPTPWDYLPQARAALTGSGSFGAIVPTINQLIDLVHALYAGNWFMVEVEELLLRSYKITEARIRPQDEMVGHTGYLIFARAVNRETSTRSEAPDSE
ncbi:MAG TPA: tRNA (adenine-N1)-methyltransferase [Aggregatilineales bacterium]|nr:tRNA (adenine-N1)-methyltransferase [Aggregatilineales bacterium]